MKLQKSIKKLLIMLMAFFSILFLSGFKKINVANINSKLTDQQGILLDVARHKMNKEEIESFISKLNSKNIQYIDLHLSDNENIDIQSKILGNENDKTILSDNDLKEIVNYANSKGIIVIPDIDIPSHTDAILNLLKVNNNKLYQKIKMKDINILDYNKVETINFIKELYQPILNDCQNQNEKYFLIDCDEVPNNVNDSQALMQFINKINNYLNDNHFQTIIWNDCLSNNTFNQLNSNINIYYWEDINNRPEMNILKNRFNVIDAKHQTHYYSMQDLNNNEELNNWLIKSKTGPSNVTCLWGENSNNIKQQQINNFAIKLNDKIQKNNNQTISNQNSSVITNSQSNQAKTISQSNQVKLISQSNQVKPISQSNQAKLISQSNQVKPISQSQSAKTISQSQLVKPISQSQSAKPISQSNQAKSISQNNSTKIISQSKLAKTISQSQLAKTIKQSSSAKPISQNYSAITNSRSQLAKIISQSSSAKAISQNNSAITNSKNNSAITNNQSNSAKIFNKNHLIRAFNKLINTNYHQWNFISWFEKLINKIKNIF